MKRKITKIGTLLASVALMFGATSWASAQDNKVTITFPMNEAHTGFIDAVIEGADAEKAKVGTTFWSASRDTMLIAKKVTNGDGVAKLGADTDPNFVGIRPATKGDKDASAVTFTVRAANGYAFVADEVYFEAIKFGTGASKAIRYRAIHDGTNYKSSTELTTVLRDNAGSGSVWQFTCPASDLSVSESTPAVKFQFLLGAGSDLDNNKEVGIRNIKITGHFVEHTCGIQVAYIAANGNVAGKHLHPVLDALQELDSWNINAELLVLPKDQELDPANFVNKYDVVVMGGNAGGGDNQPISFLKKLVGKVPALNVTKAFAYNSGRADWGTGVNIANNTANNYVVPDRYSAKHPIFSGIEKDTIVVFQADYASHLVTSDYKSGKKTGQVMQGYKDLTATAPAHTLLGTSNGLNSVAEAWVKTEAGDSIPYLFIAYDNDLIVNSDSTIQLTADAAKLYLNAVYYLDSAKVQYIMPMIDDLDKEKTTKLAFAQVKSKAEGGTTMKDTLRYVVKLSMDSVFKDMSKTEKTMPKVKITLGSETKDYDFSKPDTIWKSSSVKLVATADYYFGEVTIDTTFENKYLTKVEMPDTTWTQSDKNVADYVMTFDPITTTVDGEETPTTIYYSFDGTTYKKYDANKPDTVWKTTVVWAYAEAYLHATSDTLKQAKWTNPTLPVLPKPTITDQKADKPGSVYSVTIAAAEGTPEGATIYYTTDGSLPTTASTVYSEPFEVIGYDTVCVSAIVGNVDRYGDSDSTLHIVIDPEADKYKFTAPKITVDGNSFTIEATNSAEYATIYYTTTGDDPTENNSLVYDGKVTYLAGEFDVKAVAAADGFKTSPVTTQAFKATAPAEMPPFAKTMYKSTFNLNDPSAVKDPNTGAYTWGWFRWTPETPGGEDWSVGAKHTDSDRTEKVANKYITDQEWNDGVYYDSEKKPRVQIFENDAKTGWRHFNNWVFWKDGRKDGNSYRRILIQEGMSAKLAGALVDADSNYVATGGAIYIFNATPKAVVGPDSLLQGPFAVVVNIASGNNGLAYTDAATMNVCLASNSTGAAEMKIGEVSCVAGKMGTDTIYYYGDQKVYVRLTTESKIVLVYDFIAYKEGIDLSPLAIESIEPDGQMAPKDTAEIDADVNTFTVTFNHDIEPGAGKVQWTKGPTRKDCETSVSGNVLTVTLPADAPKEAGTTYGLLLQQNCVTDADGQSLKEGIYFYYTIKGADAIDEVSAAKEVVATHIYSISGAEIPALRPGINFVKKIYSDGSVTTEKVQVK